MSIHYSQHHLSPNDRILRWPQVHDKTGLCRSYVHKLIAEGKFPTQVKLGPKASGWLESSVNSWLEQRIAQSRTNNHEAA